MGKHQKKGVDLRGQMSFGWIKREKPEI